MRRGTTALLALLCLMFAWGGMCEEAQDTKEEIQQEETQQEEAEFYGYIGKRMNVYRRGDDDSHVLGTVEPGEVVEVYVKGRSWTRIKFEESEFGMGYVNTKFVERVQRKDPFDGPLPGTSEHVAVGVALKDLSFKPEGYKNAVKVKAGSWLSIEKIKDGRAYFPYMREEKNVSVSTENLKIYDFVPWDEAQPGDLLYAFTTFYTTSLKKEGNSGRMYNIQLASDRLTGIRVKAGECFSFNEICGPYTKENGYKSAPILAGDSEFGYGGGVCQVCSTIYNIVLRIPTVIEQMHWHSQGGVSYLPAGFDATVGTNSDMVFRNILPYDLRIEFENLSGTMTAFFFRDYEPEENAAQENEPAE